MMKALGASLRNGATPVRGSLELFVFLAVLAGFGLSTLPAQAAQARQGTVKAPAQTVTAAVTKDVDTTSSVRPNASDDARCDVGRKRLFVEGEGWIVRRVTTCY